jgi:hypothetical protein
LQFKRALVRAAINRFWTGHPKEYPDLTVVHQAMGSQGDDPILNEADPLVRAANEEKPGVQFTLAPPSTKTTSSAVTGILGRLQFSFSFENCKVRL